METQDLIQYANGLGLPASHTKDPKSSFEAADRLLHSGQWTGQRAVVITILKRFIEGRGFYPTSRELDDFGTPEDWGGLGDPCGTLLMVRRQLSNLSRSGVVEKDDLRACGIAGTRAVTWKLKGGG